MQNEAFISSVDVRQLMYVTKQQMPPEAVPKRVIHALESPRPRPRYYVTFPTYLFGTLKRLLPARTLDRILRRT